MKNKFGFILVRPQLGENIGACARSMKNFGFRNLNIVSPKFTFPNHKTKVTAVGAYNIIDNTKVFNTIDRAVSKFDIVISLSARRRDVNKKHITMEDFLNILKKRKNTEIGLMFGPEASGLSNMDLSFSNYILQIPTSKNFKSLNKYSIGVELSNPGHNHGYKNFSHKQIVSLTKLLKMFIKEYKIKKENILGHSDIAPLRKKDPGEKFPWKKLEKKRVSFSHKLNEKKIKIYRKKKIILK